MIFFSTNVITWVIFIYLLGMIWTSEKQRNFKGSKLVRFLRITTWPVLWFYLCFYVIFLADWHD